MAKDFKIFILTFLICFTTFSFARIPNDALIVVLNTDESVSLRRSNVQFFVLLPNPGIGPGLVCSLKIDIQINDLTKEMLKEISESMTVEEGFRFNGDEVKLTPTLSDDGKLSMSYFLKFINGQDFVTFARFTSTTGETLREMLGRITKHSGHKFKAQVVAKSCE